MAGDEDREELIRLENEWMQAWIRRDRQSLQQIMGDDFTLTSVTTDDLVDRNGWLNSLDRVVGKEFVYESLHVQLYGDAAVVKSSARPEGRD